MPAAGQAPRRQEGQSEHPAVRGESQESRSSSPTALQQVRPLDHSSREVGSDSFQRKPRGLQGGGVSGAASSEMPIIPQREKARAGTASGDWLVQSWDDEGRRSRAEGQCSLLEG